MSMAAEKLEHGVLLLLIHIVFFSDEMMRCPLQSQFFLEGQAGTGRQTRFQTIHDLWFRYIPMAL